VIYSDLPFSWREWPREIPSDVGGSMSVVNITFIGAPEVLLIIIGICRVLFAVLSHFSSDVPCNYIVIRWTKRGKWDRHLPQGGWLRIGETGGFSPGGSWKIDSHHPAEELAARRRGGFGIAYKASSIAGQIMYGYG
jgi:hypothetical protein